MATTFKKHIKKNFGTVKEFADAMGITAPTAGKYMNDPMSMSVNFFYRVSVKTNTSVYELHDIITASYD